MAGKWQGTREPGIYRQDGPTGTRYKYAFRDARGKVTSTTFPRIRDAQALKNSMGDRRAARDLPDVSKSKKTLTDAWDHMVATGRQKPSTLASYRVRWITHIDPVLGGRLLFSIRRPKLEAFSHRSRPRPRSTPGARCNRSSTRCARWRYAPSGSVATQVTGSRCRGRYKGRLARAVPQHRAGREDRGRGRGSIQGVRVDVGSRRSPSRRGDNLAVARRERRHLRQTRQDQGQQAGRPGARLDGDEMRGRRRR
jgi:hypothetical protein